MYIQRLYFSLKTSQPISTLYILIPNINFQWSQVSGTRYICVPKLIPFIPYIYPTLLYIYIYFPILLFRLNPSKLKQKISVCNIFVASLLLQLNFSYNWKTVCLVVGSALWVNLKNICFVGGKN